MTQKTHEEEKAELKAGLKMIKAELALDDRDYEYVDFHGYDTLSFYGQLKLVRAYLQLREEKHEAAP